MVAAELEHYLAAAPVEHPSDADALELHTSVMAAFVRALGWQGALSIARLHLFSCTDQQPALVALLRCVASGGVDGRAKVEALVSRPPSSPNAATLTGEPMPQEDRNLMAISQLA